MRILILVLFFAVISLNATAQEVYRYRDMKPTKCYVLVFDTEEKIKWTERDCNINGKISSGIIIDRDDVGKIENYQKELKNKGYRVEISGMIDKKTIKAHNRYLRKKKREQR